MPLPFDVFLDTELRVMHTRSECAGARIPAKYRYLERVAVRTPEQARELDSQYRACDGCLKDLRKKQGPQEKQSRYRRRTPE